MPTITGGWRRRLSYFTSADAKTIAEKVELPLSHDDGGRAAAEQLNHLARAYLLAQEQVIWNFAADTTATGFTQINGDPAGPVGARGRAEIGLRASTPSGMGLDLSGSYDGIGAKDYDAFTGKATVRVPLN
jgi:hypothetical protein